MPAEMETVSSTRCCTKHGPDFRRFVVAMVCVWAAWLGTSAAIAQTPLTTPTTPGGLETLRLERTDGALLLSTVLDIPLPETVQSALLKGVPVVFVARAELVRLRWYWANRSVRTTVRHMRLAYQPLTKRWRVQVAPGEISATGVGVSLAQTHDSLSEAMAVVRRLSGWRVAEPEDLDEDGRYRLEFSYRLDVTQLPRPLQIGLFGQDDWNISFSASQAVPQELLR